MNREARPGPRPVPRAPAEVYPVPAAPQAAIQPAAPEPSDEELMARFRDGQASAFDQILDRHRRAVYGFLLRSTRNREDADDIFQEVFLRVVRAAPTWKPEARLTTWVFTIARNLLIDRGRARKSQPDPVPFADGDGSPGVSIDAVASTASRAEELVLAAERDRVIEAAVAALPDEQREAFLLKREGLTFEEIGEVLAVPRNTVKSRLRYALEKVRARLDQQGLLAAGRRDEGTR